MFILEFSWGIDGSTGKIQPRGHLSVCLSIHVMYTWEIVSSHVSFKPILSYP